LVALKNYVARIHGTGIKKAVVPEFNHEKTPAPVHEVFMKQEVKNWIKQACIVGERRYN